ncbi:importin subunit alpha-like [Gossypium arboreum]|uniref:importin subunit alpha-like n=1 Tax=Gossypium arboreum TaxID=29729 RepID=UPI0022F1A4B9|nr:importin subunit alpha-like [Gossypium arboreum]
MEAFFLRFLATGHGGGRCWRPVATVDLAGIKLHRESSHPSHPLPWKKALFGEQNEGSNAICTLGLFRPIIHPHQIYEVTEELKGENYCSGCRLVKDNIQITKNNHEESFRKEFYLVIIFVNYLHDMLIGSASDLIEHWAVLMMFHSLTAAGKFGCQTRPPIEEVSQAGVVPRFVELLGSPSDYVREQAVLALGNIAAVSLRCRDLVLGHGALLPLLALLNELVSRSMLRNATWTLSRFCKPPFDQVKLVLPTLARLIHSKDEVILAKACWALSYLSDGTNDKIQAVIESGVLGRLVELLMHPSPSVISPALYTVKRIVIGDDVQIQATIEANIISPLVHLLQNAEFDIKKQAAQAISNATSGGTHDQIRFLVSQGCIKPLYDLLCYFDLEVVTICFQGLENILKVEEADKNMGITGGVNLYAQMIDAAEGREKIEYLHYHDNTEIYKKAVEVLETYW